MEDLESMTLAQLRARCRELELDCKGNKAELVEAISTEERRLKRQAQRRRAAERKVAGEAPLPRGRPKKARTAPSLRRNEEEEEEVEVDVEDEVESSEEEDEEVSDNEVSEGEVDSQVVQFVNRNIDTSKYPELDIDTYNGITDLMKAEINDRYMLRLWMALNGGPRVGPTSNYTNTNLQKVLRRYSAITIEGTTTGPKGKGTTLIKKQKTLYRIVEQVREHYPEFTLGELLTIMESLRTHYGLSKKWSGYCATEKALGNLATYIYATSIGDTPPVKLPKCESITAKDLNKNTSAFYQLFNFGIPFGEEGDVDEDSGEEVDDDERSDEDSGEDERSEGDTLLDEEDEEFIERVQEDLADVPRARPPTGPIIEDDESEADVEDIEEEEVEDDVEERSDEEEIAPPSQLHRDIQKSEIIRTMRECLLRQ